MILLSRIIRPQNTVTALAAVTSTYFCILSSGRTGFGVTQAFSVHPLLSPLSRRSDTTTTLHMSSSASTTTTTTTPQPQVLVPIADGSEEIETCCLTDTLTRCGAHVVVASVMPNDQTVCRMSRGLTVVADTTIGEAVGRSWDLVALPGGMPGATHLRDSTDLRTILTATRTSGKKIAAVCASPAVVLRAHGLLPDSSSTCYPAEVFRSTLNQPSDEAVVVQGNVITSQGPGTSLAFALQLGEELFGKEKADQIAKEMLVER